MDEFAPTQEDCCESITDFNECSGRVVHSAESRAGERGSLSGDTNPSPTVSVSEAGPGDAASTTIVRPIVTFPSDIREVPENHGTEMAVEDGTPINVPNGSPLGNDKIVDILCSLRLTCDLLQNAQHAIERDSAQLKKDFKDYFESNDRALKQINVAVSKDTDKVIKEKEKKRKEKEKEKEKEKKQYGAMEILLNKAMVTLKEQTIGMKEIEKRVEKLRNFTEKFSKKQIPNFPRQSPKKGKKK